MQHLYLFPRLFLDQLILRQKYSRLNDDLTHDSQSKRPAPVRNILFMQVHHNERSRANQKYKHYTHADTQDLVEA